MEEIGKALKSIFDKLSDFFDIFDLSFFVSGVLTTALLYTWGKLRGFGVPSIPTTTFATIGYILFCYITGLLSFAVGRWIRMGIIGYPFRMWRKYKKMGYAFDENFENIITDHGVDKSIAFQNYFAIEPARRQRKIWRLYIRMWAELRSSEEYAKSLSFLKRYWVMAATYDGFSISFVVGLLLAIETKLGLLKDPIVINNRVFYFLIAAFLTLFIACLREADRFVIYQMEEVVATIASKKPQEKSEVRETKKDTSKIEKIKSILK